MPDAAPAEAIESLSGLADLPIEVAEAMYSPDFVELVTLAAGGTPMVLPMSFTLDLAGNAVRFSSPAAAARIVNLARDPRCCVSFTRVTSGNAPVLMQGVASLAEVVEGVRRGPSRRFSVTPRFVIALDAPPRRWRFPPAGWTASEPPPRPEGAVPPGVTAAAVREEDLRAIAGFETTVVALRDGDGWPVSLPVEVRGDGEALVVTLPESGVPLRDGAASLVGHTWTRDGPRFLALTGSARFNVPSESGSGYNDERGSALPELLFRPRRAMRRL